MSRAKPVLVMSQFNGSARLKMAQLGWLSHFELSRGITIMSHVEYGMRCLFDPAKPYLAAWLKSYDPDTEWSSFLRGDSMFVTVTTTVRLT